MLDMLKALTGTGSTERQPGKHTAGYAPPGKGAPPGTTPAPRPASAPAPQRTGTTAQEAAMARQLGTTIQETHARTGEALSLLHDLATPGPSEGPSQIEALVQAVQAIAESQRRQEVMLERLCAVLRPRAT